MEEKIEKALNWLSDLKENWLPSVFPRATKDSERITSKFVELEEILKAPFDELNLTRKRNEISSTENEEFFEVFPLTSVRRTTNDENTKNLIRPTIFIRRIPICEAENYLPTSCKIDSFSDRFSARKKRSKRQKRRPKRKSKSIGENSINLDRTKIEEKKKTKRKLRATDNEDDDLLTLANLPAIELIEFDEDCAPICRQIGRNGILSQNRLTKQNNDSTQIFDEPTVNRNYSSNDRDALSEQNFPSSSSQNVENIFQFHFNEQNEPIPTGNNEQIDSNFLFSTSNFDD